MRRLVLLPLVCSACVLDVAPTASNTSDDNTGLEATAPLMGVTGTGDFADRACQIVLRDFGRVSAGNGFAVNGSRWVFEGRVDVDISALAEGAVPMLLVNAGSSGWRAVPATASTGVSSTMERFLFHVDGSEGVDVPGPGMSGTALSRAKILVVPYLSKAIDGGEARLFDHNRIVDALASYTLDSGNGFSVGEDLDVCSPPAGPTLTFASDFSESASGPVVGGRTVVVDYDLARLPDCRQTYNGVPAFSVTANVTFLPMNVRQNLSLVDENDPTKSAPATFAVPAGATEMVVYFRNADRAGCNAYDSDFGRDYHFPVVDQHVEWMGDVAASLSRGGSRRCDGATAVGEQVVFDSWARQRAAITDLCFSVYEPQLTDDGASWADGSIWQDLDVRVHHRFGSTGPFATEFVSLAGRVGNNAQYALDLRAFDPFQWGRCSEDLPTTTTSAPGGDHIQATLEVYFSVNGDELRPASGGVYRVVYDDAASSPRVTCD